MTEQELLQVPEELRELFIALDKQGWNPQMCDTLVPYYANGVPCGMHPSSGEGDSAVPWRAITMI